MDASKNFLIRCPNCRWAEVTTGIDKDLEHLHEYKKSCASCGKPRKFRCPNCGQQAIMRRLKKG